MLLHHKNVKQESQIQKQKQYKRIQAVMNIWKRIQIFPVGSTNECCLLLSFRFGSNERFANAVVKSVAALTHSLS
jgi:hypothetical protein